MAVRVMSTTVEICLFDGRGLLYRNGLVTVITKYTSLRSEVMIENIVEFCWELLKQNPFVAVLFVLCIVGIGMPNKGTGSFKLNTNSFFTVVLVAVSFLAGMTFQSPPDGSVTPTLPGTSGTGSGGGGSGSSATPAKPDFPASYASVISVNTSVSPKKWTIPAIDPAVGHLRVYVAGRVTFDTISDPTWTSIDVSGDPDVDDVTFTFYDAVTGKESKVYDP